MLGQLQVVLRLVIGDLVVLAGGLGTLPTHAHPETSSTEMTHALLTYLLRRAKNLRLQPPPTQEPPKNLSLGLRLLSS